MAQSSNLFKTTTSCDFHKEVMQIQRLPPNSWYPVKAYKKSPLVTQNSTVKILLLSAFCRTKKNKWSNSSREGFPKAQDKDFRYISDMERRKHLHKLGTHETVKLTKCGHESFWVGNNLLIASSSSRWRIASDRLWLRGDNREWR